MDGWTGWRADLAEPDTPRRRGELPFLVVSTVAIAVAAQVTDPGTAFEVVLVALAVAAFAVWVAVPRMPAEVFAALVVAPVTAAVGRAGNLELSFFLLTFVALCVGWHIGSNVRGAAIVVIAAASPLLVAEVLVPEANINWIPWTCACAFTFLLGRAIHRQTMLIKALEEARTALADQAVAEERRRIARELHDLAGHTVAAVLLHVTGARHVLRRDVDEAERALLDAETVGRASLDQIRATVAALRTHERGTDAALAGSADVASLIDDYRRAGLVITATLPPDLTDIDGAVGMALHRIALEALTNVARHAPRNRVELTVGVERKEVHLLVADHGQPGAPPTSEDGHFGLVGMRERARALGGDLQAGPTPDGWRVQARLPAALTPKAGGRL